MTLDEQVGAELGYAEKPVHRKRLYRLGVSLHHDLMLLSVVRKDGRLSAGFRNDLTDETVEMLADQVVVERGTLPLDEVYQALRADARNHGVTDLEAIVRGRPQPDAAGDGYLLYRVGDAVSSRSLHAALFDAYRLAVTL